MSSVHKYFALKRFQSFIRQLNGWGFKRLHRLGSDHGCYYHECFLRGIPQLTWLMRRAPSNKGKSIPNIEGEPNFYEMSELRPLPPVNNQWPATLTSADKTTTSIHSESAAISAATFTYPASITHMYSHTQSGLNFPAVTSPKDREFLSSRSVPATKTKSPMSQFVVRDSGQSSLMLLGPTELPSSDSKLRALYFEQGANHYKQPSSNVVNEDEYQKNNEVCDTEHQMTSTTNDVINPYFPTHPNVCESTAVAAVSAPGKTQHQIMTSTSNDVRNPVFLNHPSRDQTDTSKNSENFQPAIETNNHFHRMHTLTKAASSSFITYQEQYPCHTNNFENNLGLPLSYPHHNSGGQWSSYPPPSYSCGVNPQHRDGRFNHYPVHGQQLLPLSSFNDQAQEDRAKENEEAGDTDLSQEPFDWLDF